MSVSNGTLWDTVPNSSTESLPRWTLNNSSFWRSSEEKEYSSGSQRAVALLTLGVIILLSALGNTAVLYVVGHQLHFKTVTNVFIVSLAVSDLLTTVICMPLAFVRLVAGADVLSTDACLISGVISSALGVVSTLMITFIAVDRYHVVVKVPGCSIKGKKTALHLAGLVVATCWLLAGLLSLPWHLITSGTDRQVAEMQAQYHHCMYIFHIKSSPDGTVYSVLFILMCYIVPSGVISYCAAQIWLTVKHHDSRIRPATIHANQLRFSGELRTAKTVLVIVLFFYLCRLPYGVLGFVYGLAQTDMSAGVDTAALWLFWNSCAVNPCIYAVRNPVLAEALHLRRLATGWRRRQYDQQQQQLHRYLPTVSATASDALAVNSSDITVKLNRSDSVASVLLFSSSRKALFQSTTTTSTSV